MALSERAAAHLLAEAVPFPAGAKIATGQLHGPNHAETDGKRPPRPFVKKPLALTNSKRLHPYYSENDVHPNRGNKVSFLEKMRAAEVEPVPQPTSWHVRLERVRGKVDFDGLERISTQTLLDFLEVPQRERTAGAYRQLAKEMAQLGWTPVRVRDFTRGGYKEQVRGYVRQA
jgi:hypothetical protein